VSSPKPRTYGAYSEDTQIRAGDNGGSERVPTGPSVTLRDDFSDPFQVSRGADSQRCARWAWLDRKLQLVTLKISQIFSRNILLVFGCECKLRGRHAAQAAQAVS
jgi:hypothetical protein